MPTLKRILRFAFSIKGFTVLFVLEIIRLEAIGEGYSAPGIVLGYLFFISPWIAWRFYGAPRLEKWIDERADTLPVSFQAARLRRRHRDAIGAIEDSDMDERSKKQARSEADKTLREKMRELIKG